MGWGGGSCGGGQRPRAPAQHTAAPLPVQASGAPGSPICGPLGYVCAPSRVATCVYLGARECVHTCSLGSLHTAMGNQHTHVNPQGSPRPGLFGGRRGKDQARSLSPACALSPLLGIVCASPENLHPGGREALGDPGEGALAPRLYRELGLAPSFAAWVPAQPVFLSSRGQQTAGPRALHPKTSRGQRRASGLSWLFPVLLPKGPGDPELRRILE